MRRFRLAKHLCVVPGSYTEEGGHRGALFLLEFLRSRKIISILRMKEPYTAFH